MKTNLKKNSTAALLGAKPVQPATSTKTHHMSIGAILAVAKAMVASMKAEATPAVIKAVQARVGAPKTTAKVGTIRRLPTRTA